MPYMLPKQLYQCMMVGCTEPNGWPAADLQWVEFDNDPEDAGWLCKKCDEEVADAADMKARLTPAEYDAAMKEGDVITTRGPVLKDYLENSHIFHEWQPIDSAPKSGATILVGHSLRSDVSKDIAGSVHIVHWDEDKGGWVVMLENEDYENLQAEPTHWTLLPWCRA